MNDPRTLQPQPHPDSPKRGRNGVPSDANRQARLHKVALDAQTEKEQYRRMLAASVATERTATERIGETLREAESVRNLLSRAELSRGVAEGRVKELKRERETLEARTELLETELLELRDELGNERKRSSDEVSSARTRVAFLEAQLESVRDERQSFAFTALQLRTRVLMIGAISCYVLAVGFFTQLIFSLLQTETPPFRLMGVAFALFVAGALLHGRAAHELADEPLV